MSSRGKGNTSKPEDDLQSIVKTSVLKLCSSEEFINQITVAIVSTISEKFDIKIEKLEKINNEMQAKLKDQEKMIHKLIENNEQYEQAIKCKSVRIYGCKESKTETAQK